MEKGVNDFESPMHRIPLFDVTSMAPQDIMHVLAEGVLKTEIAAMLFTLVRKRKWGITLSVINKACQAYKWPPDHHAPNFRDVILEGHGTGNQARPKRGCHVHGTAGAVLDFTLHSLIILRPFIQKLDDPVWTCWNLMVAITMMCMQHTFSLAQVQMLAGVIAEHQRVFLSIPEYSHLFKPKHHFCSHIPLDILRFGPARHYWCMRFEALNQVFKQIARGGNYIDTCKRCAEFFSMRCTLSIRYGLHEHWGDTHSVSHDAVQTVVEMPPDDGTPHNTCVRVLLQNSSQSDVASPVQIRWVKKLSHAGCMLTAQHTWVYFKSLQNAANCNVNKPITLALVHNIAQMQNMFYVVLHVFKQCVVSSESLLQMPLVKILPGSPQVGIFPLRTLSIMPMWRVPEPDMADTYRFVPRLFG